MDLCNIYSRHPLHTTLWKWLTLCSMLFKMVDFQPFLVSITLLVASVFQHKLCTLQLQQFTCFRLQKLAKPLVVSVIVDPGGWWAPPRLLLWCSVCLWRSRLMRTEYWSVSNRFLLQNNEPVCPSTSSKQEYRIIIQTNILSGMDVG